MFKKLTYGFEVPPSLNVLNIWTDLTYFSR